MFLCGPLPDVFEFVLFQPSCSFKENDAGKTLVPEDVMLAMGRKLQNMLIIITT